MLLRVKYVLAVSLMRLDIPQMVSLIGRLDSVHFANIDCAS